MKLLITALLFSFVALANIDRTLVDLKTNNLLMVQKLYNSLESTAIKNDKTAFCQDVPVAKGILVNIFKQDYQLIENLRQFNNPLWIDYAKHLEENAPSDLFTMEYLLDACSGDEFSFDEIKKSLTGSILNNNFLKMYHTQFVATLD